MIIAILSIVTAVCFFVFGYGLGHASGVAEGKKEQKRICQNEKENSGYADRVIKGGGRY